MLLKQLTHPVRWEESVQNMAAEGAGVFIEIGPGKVLQGLIKRINGSVKTRGYEKLSEIADLQRGI